jgi:hypothetical protein
VRVLAGVMVSSVATSAAPSPGLRPPSPKGSGELLRAPRTSPAPSPSGNCSVCSARSIFPLPSGHSSDIHHGTGPSLIGRASSWESRRRPGARAGGARRGRCHP